MKRTLTLLLLLAIAILCSCKKTTLTDIKTTKKKITINNSLELIDFINGYIQNDKWLTIYDYIPEMKDNYLGNANYEINIKYSKCLEHVEIYDLNGDFDSLPRVDVIVNNENDYYHAFENVCYGAQNYPVDYYFNQIEFDEFYINKNELKTYRTWIQYQNYIENNEIILDPKETYQYNCFYQYEENEFQENLNDYYMKNTQELLLQYCFYELFSINYQSEVPINDFKKLHFDKEEFTTIDNIVTFNLEICLYDKDVKVDGEINLNNYYMIMNVDKIYKDETISCREDNYTLEVRTNTFQDVNFNLKREFVESIDAKLW